MSLRAPFGRGYGSFSAEAHRITGATWNLLDGQPIGVQSPSSGVVALLCHLGNAFTKFTI